MPESNWNGKHILVVPFTYDIDELFKFLIIWLIQRQFSYIQAVHKVEVFSALTELKSNHLCHYKVCKFLFWAAMISETI